MIIVGEAIDDPMCREGRREIILYVVATESESMNHLQNDQIVN